MAGWDRRRWRIEQAIRLELTNLGLSDAQIADQIGLSYPGYATLKASPEYKSIKTSMLTQVACAADAEMVADIKGLRQKLLEVGVPVAVDTLLYYASQRSDPKLALEAAKQILDREGHLAQVSRIGLTTVTPGDGINAKDEEVGNELIAALAAVKNVADKVIAGAEAGAEAAEGEVDPNTGIPGGTAVTIQ